MRVRRPRRASLAAAALAAAALAAPALHASASDSRISFLVPPSPQEGDFVEGTATIKARATSSLGLSSISISVVPKDAAGEPVGTSEKYKALPVTSEGVVTYEWDPAAPGGSNGTYSIVAKSRSQLDENLSAPYSVATIQEVRVNLAPAQPQGVSASLDGGVAVVKWASNPEADISGYRVLRSSGSGFAPIGTADAGSTLYRDSSPPGGAALTYQVVALRPTWDRKGVLESRATASGPLNSPGPSTPSPAVSTKVEVAPPSGAHDPTAAPSTSKPLRILPKPPPVAAPPPYETSAKPGGFEEQLPYVAGQAPGEDVIAANADDRDPGTVDQTAAQTGLAGVDKTRYAAAGLLLFVFALHVVRSARKIMRPVVRPFRTA